MATEGFENWPLIIAHSLSIDASCDKPSEHHINVIHSKARVTGEHFVADSIYMGGPSFVLRRCFRKRGFHVRRDSVQHAHNMYNF